MAKFVIPREDATTPMRGGQEETLPAGLWTGKVEVVRVGEAVRDMDDVSGPVFMIDDGAIHGEIASVQLGDISPVSPENNSVDWGNRKFFDEQYLLSESYDNGTTIRWDEPTGNENENWRFDQTRRRLTNLALAVGATEESEAGVGPVDDFDAVFRRTGQADGGLDGAIVVFEVEHETYWSKKQQKDITRAVVRAYSGA